MILRTLRYGLAVTLRGAAHRLAPELNAPPPNNWAVERLAFRQQLAIFRHQKRPSFTNADRLFWVLQRRLFPTTWHTSLVAVQPSTVVRWHREWVRLFWARKSERPATRRGRPPIDNELKHLIHRFATENKWGATRIHGELQKLGINISERTVSNYLKKLFPVPEDRIRQWRAFLRNESVAAMDFVVVPTATAGWLYALVVLDHRRRKLVHTNATAHPTAEWVSQQLREAFPGDAALPRYLVHDRDTTFQSEEVQDTLEGIGIQTAPTRIQSPWQNGICERFIGSLRRELLRHVIILGERHLIRLLREYGDYYNSYRTHLALDKDTPLSRHVETKPKNGQLTGIPHLGGLHHHYSWSDGQPE